MLDCRSIPNGAIQTAALIANNPLVVDYLVSEPVFCVGGSDPAGHIAICAIGKCQATYAQPE
jgi:hypothetical protein